MFSKVQIVRSDKTGMPTHLLAYVYSMFSYLMGRIFFLVTLLLTGSCATLDKDQGRAPFASFDNNKQIADFDVAYMITDHQGDALAAKLIHRTFQFPIYLMVLDSVPQAAMWFETKPTNDKGTAHALEHVVLGKGKSGKYLALLQEMELAQSGALTFQGFTKYHFNAPSGEDSFFKILSQNLHMFFNRDFDKVDIERELYHFGVKTTQDDLSLIEKGTVYTEVNANHGYYDSYYALIKDIFGPEFYGGYSAGGTPEGVRELSAEEIIQFYHEKYRLDSGFGAIIGMPSSLDPEKFVERLSRVFSTVAEGAPAIALTPRDTSSHSLLPRQDKAPSIRPFASSNTQQATWAWFGWPVVEQMNTTDLYQLRSFLKAFAGDSESYLYKRMAKSTTRKQDLGIQNVTLSLNDSFEQKFVSGSFSGISSEHMTEERLNLLRNALVEEIRVVTTWPAGSDALVELNKKIIHNIHRDERSIIDYLEQPPGFGSRSLTDWWKKKFEDIDNTQGFRRPIVDGERREAFIKALESGENIWAPFIEKFKLLSTPYIHGAKPSSDMLTTITAVEQARIAAKTSALKQLFNTDDTQYALQKYLDEYEKIDLDISSKQVLASRPGFLPTPPLSPDSSAIVTRARAMDGVDILSIEYSSSPKISLAVENDLRVFHPDEYPYLPLFIQLIDQIGIRKGDTVLSHEELSRSLEKNVLGLDFYLSSSPSSDDYIHRFGFSMSALDTEELKNGLASVIDILNGANFSSESLPRIREIISWALLGFEGTYKNYPEYWLDNLANNYFNQQHALAMYTSYTATMTHLYHRYDWWFSEPPSNRRAIEAYIADINVKLESVDSKDDLLVALETIAPSDQDTQKLHRYLLRRVIELSPAFKEEISYLLRTALDDWEVVPTEVLSKLREMLSRVRHRQSMTGYVVADSRNTKQAIRELSVLSPVFSTKPKVIHQEPRRAWIDDNVNPRLLGNTKLSQHVAFIMESEQTAHVYNRAPSLDIRNYDRNDLLDAIALQMLGGGGPESLFMKTWQAGLAYSNGVATDINNGYKLYSLQKSPNLSQSLSFVLGEVRRAKEYINASHVDYAVASFFKSQRAMLTPSARGAMLYNEMKVGIAPEHHVNFRKALLSLREEEGIFEEILGRIDNVVSEIILNNTNRSTAAQYFFVGPESQIASLDFLLTDGEVTRVYASDFWLR